MYVPPPYPYLAVCRHLLVFPHTHTSGMRNEFVTFCFLFFVQAVRIRQPFLPPAPREIPKGSCIVYVVLHTSGMLTLVCFFVHVQMETQICGNSGYDPPPLTHALLS